MDREKLESEATSSENTIALKGGIDVSQLTSGEGTVFEIDVDRNATSPMASDMFKGEELFNQIPHSLWEEEDSSESDKDASLPFDKLKTKMIKVTDDGGVVKKVLREGTGPVVPEGALVRVHYNGYLEYSDEPYDSTRLRSKPYQARLGKSGLIPGMEVAIETMRRGELSRFVVSPQYAFREAGCPPRIPPNSTILFEIELLSFVDYKAASDFEASQDNEKKEVTFEQLLEVAAAEKRLGNDFFETKSYRKAITRYQKAINLLEKRHLQNEDEELVWKTAILKLYLNLSLCYLRMKHPEKCVIYCRKVLELDENNVKSHYRLGQAFMHLGDFHKSKQHLVRAANLAPGNLEIREELQRLDKNHKKFKDIETEFPSQAFGGIKQESGQNTTGYEISESVRKQLEDLKLNDSLMHLVLPDILAREELEGAKMVAEKLGLKYKEVSSGIKIYKDGPPPLDEHHLV